MTEGVVPSVKRTLSEINDYSKYYVNITWCQNCHVRNTSYILKGHKLDNLTVLCDNCGCKVSLKG